ncbi:tryptophan-rich sensory protein [Salana multivorans]
MTDQPHHQPTARREHTDRPAHRERPTLVTGASGYIGGLLVPELLARGQRVRVLARSPRRLQDREWAQDVEIVQGDATDAGDLRRALDGVGVAYYLLHSMDGDGDFVVRDRALASRFATAAAEAGIERVVYLSGLHPSDEDLSEHLASRVEVGEILLDGPVPAAVLQAGIVLGAGSASFDMLRHLTERLPAMVAPRWLESRIQPIAADEVIHYLAGAADLPADLNRTLDIAGPDVLTYREMIQGYARVAGLGRRFVQVVPVLTPRLASHWVGLVTPVPAGVAKPLVGSLVHDAVADEQDVLDLIGPPPGGRAGYQDALRAAIADVDPGRWRRTFAAVSGATTACAVAGSLLTDPDSAWYRRIAKPRWQPPRWAFPVAWTSLFAGTAVAATATIADLEEDGHDDDARAFKVALAVNLTLNAAWTAAFFRLRSPWLATVVAGALAVSAGDLARRAAPTGTVRAVVLGAYAGWSTFATALSLSIARRNR